MSPDFESIHTFVKEALHDIEGGHDYWHAVRVCSLSEKIVQTEPGNMNVVKAAALLHDVFDAKFYSGTPESVRQKLMEVLFPLGFEEHDIQHIYDIIMNMSYKGGFAKENIDSPEFFIVRDADRLDALGAIGIYRAFNYGGN
ncbi:MAG: HD domain-containing protein, partial [Bacteroidota bacterium]